MTEWRRRVRGAIGVGLSWAAGWAVFGAGFGVGISLLFPSITGVAYGALGNALGFAMFGFIGGGIYAVALHLAEGRRRFDELSLPRFAALGGASGFLLGALVVVAELAWSVPGLIAADAVLVGVTTALGAGCAAATLLVARAAERQESLGEGEDIAEVGLSESERRELLDSPD